MSSQKKAQPRAKKLMFTQKLWEILNDPQWASWVAWHEGGRSVTIPSRQAFAENVIPAYWEPQHKAAEATHLKPAWEKAWNSFDRQLRNYNFKKLDTVNLMVFAHESFVQGQKDNMLAMRPVVPPAPEEVDAEDAEEAAEDAADLAVAKLRRLSGPPETPAEVARLRLRLTRVVGAVEAAEASVFCAEQRLAALQAENLALWGHFADAAAAMGGAAGGAAALRGVAAAIAAAAAAADFEAAIETGDTPPRTPGA